MNVPGCRRLFISSARGMLNRQIAAEVNLTRSTANQYVSRILAKTESVNRVQAAVKWATGKIKARGRA
jgi:DNA-binding NarL/FixJ family response regulator